ncbi:hypothetical protein ALP29_200510 [Pseudomonas syringae pv. avii]|uniref:Uncharacterized protein n=1 Tax=Pseudomonas syringae pv. avii TaxID=663959 RepID=A0A3M5UAT7_PSESX|nr:hypothetical protein ALP29_200510 [Pseudomonas syringae pv. avii]
MQQLIGNPLPALRMPQVAQQHVISDADQRDAHHDAAAHGGLSKKPMPCRLTCSQGTAQRDRHQRIGEYGKEA